MGLCLTIASSSWALSLDQLAFSILYPHAIFHSCYLPLVLSPFPYAIDSSQVSLDVTQVADEMNVAQITRLQESLLQFGCPFWVSRHCACYWSILPRWNLYKSCIVWLGIFGVESRSISGWPTETKSPFVLNKSPWYILDVMFQRNRDLCSAIPTYLDGKWGAHPILQLLPDLNPRQNVE